MVAVPMRWGSCLDCGEPRHAHGGDAPVCDYRGSTLPAYLLCRARTLFRRGGC